jgi:glycosyltransferase involved in cell wall biosynthesis
MALRKEALVGGWLLRMTMAIRNLISVIIPCYNQAGFLRQAIESVLAQIDKDFEIIVVDDGSTEDTLGQAGRYREVIYLRQENQGLASARNTGLRASKGEFLVFLDADDRLLPEAFEIGLRSFDRHPDSAFVAGHVRLISAEGSPLPSPAPPEPFQEVYPELLRHNFIWTPGSVMYRRSAFDAVKGFNPSVDGSADYDLNIRIANRLAVHWHGKTVLEYRIHSGSMSRRASLMLKTAVTVRRSHRKFVKGNKSYAEALASGIRSVQENYGEKTIREIAASLHSREWNAVLQGALAILRYYPQGLMRVTSKKLYRSLCNLRSV